MNDDYLWDGTGEADADVRQLEALLGELRHQPRPLALPETPVVKLAPRTVYGWPVRRVAAIAAVALLALTAALWFGLRRQVATPTDEIAKQQPSDATREAPKPEATKPETAQIAGRKAEPQELRPSQRIRRAPRPHAATPRHDASREEFLDAAARAEGERAKEQLLFALHTASAKLGLAQKKIQQHSEPQS